MGFVSSGCQQRCFTTVCKVLQKCCVSCWYCLHIPSLSWARVAVKPSKDHFGVLAAVLFSASCVISVWLFCTVILVAYLSCGQQGKWSRGGFGLSSQLEAGSRAGFQCTLCCQILFCLCCFDTLNLICVGDAFSFINRNPYVYSCSVPRSPLEACMWLVTSLNLEGQQWGCWHRDCACFQRLLRQSCSFCLFYKDITKWCTCIFHYTCIDQYVEGLLQRDCFPSDKVQFRILCLLV